MDEIGFSDVDAEVLNEPTSVLNDHTPPPPLLTVATNGNLETPEESLGKRICSLTSFFYYKSIKREV